MKAVLLAGGFGTRLAEETSLRPKPMVEIGGRPILWHIMKMYAHYGIKDFIVCLGYKGEYIKDYFINYSLRSSDLTIDLQTREIAFHAGRSEDWRITLVDTGVDTMTGGRIKRILPYLRDETAFCMTYGDGVSDVDINALVALHRTSGRAATLTAVQPPGRFGALVTEGDRVSHFREKPDGDGGWINGGFFVLSPAVGAYIDDDSTVWEREPLERLASDGQLSVHRHRGFWQPMDTLRDREHLENLWSSGKAPWRTW
jgi:glucose-1-phosphate cytidylyltransferase